MNWIVFNLRVNDISWPSRGTITRQGFEPLDNGNSSSCAIESRTAASANTAALSFLVQCELVSCISGEECSLWLPVCTQARKCTAVNRPRLLATRRNYRRVGSAPLPTNYSCQSAGPARYGPFHYITLQEERPRKYFNVFMKV